MRSPLSVLFLLFIANGVGGQTEPYINPLDGKTYEAEWKEYQAGQSVEGPGAGGATSRVRLLSSQQVFAKNIDPREMADYIESTKANVSFITGKPDKPLSVLVETLITPGGKPKFSLASRGEVPRGLLEKVYKSLGSLPDLRSRLDDLRYQLEVEVGGGQKPAEAGKGNQD